jgi:N-acetylated-alpha-linked acidic dipeptidase
MADAGVLPYDFSTYAREILAYLQTASKKAEESTLKLNFDTAFEAAQRFFTAASSLKRKEQLEPQNVPAFNQSLLDAEHALLSAQGLPGRPWYRHTIYAPGEFTGYAAVVIPGVNEAIDARDETRAEKQISILADALNRAAVALENAK